MKVSSVFPPGAKIALVGEAPGEQEEKTGFPFVGHSGQELTRLLRDAGIDRQECAIANVFLERPPKNDIESFFTSKKEGYSDFPPLKAGKYIRKEYFSEVLRLWKELSAFRPNIIVTLGGTATWALLGSSKISSLRGAIDQVTLGDITFKILPTFHPAAVCRQWELRSTVVADLMKARRESHSPELSLLSREIWIEPSLQDMKDFAHKYIHSQSTLGFDIETKRNCQISCISFAPDPQHSLVVPFIDERKPGWSFWPTLQEELSAWAFVREILSSEIPKVGQNGLYDIQYLWQQYGIPVRNYLHDTMLLHHSLQPELQKGLAFLGSVYCNERAWKRLRTHKEEKPDE